MVDFVSEKYKFVKGGLIFISLRLGLQNIESSYIPMIPKLFINLHNNIGFVSGKKKRAFYFIGIIGDKLILADPHFNQNIDESRAKKLIHLVKLTAINAQISKQRWIRQLLRRWRFISFVKNVSKKKLELMLISLLYA